MTQGVATKQAWSTALASERVEVPEQSRFEILMRVRPPPGTAELEK